MRVRKSGLSITSRYRPYHPAPPSPTASPRPVLTVVDYSGWPETLRAPVRARRAVQHVTVDENYHQATPTLALSALLPLRFQLSNPTSNTPQHLPRVTKKLVREPQGHPLKVPTNNER